MHIKDVEQTSLLRQATATRTLYRLEQAELKLKKLQEQLYMIKVNISVTEKLIKRLEKDDG